jgi:hypothetical protein
MQLVGITGRAGSGKDTVADYLCSTHGFLKLSFAGPLKAMLAIIDMPEPVDRALKEQPIPGFDFSWREAAQKLGTEFGRGLDPDIWTKIMERKLAHFADDVRIVFSDVRFENEAAMIRKLGGKVLHITGRAAELGANAGHASEAGILREPGDPVIHNEASLGGLFHLVRAALWGAE